MAWISEQVGRSAMIVAFSIAGGRGVDLAGYVVRLGTSR